jgi:hypothetical protein
MAQETSLSGIQVKRIFEQPEGTLSLYSDFCQVIGTGHEVVLQFCETIPGPPAGPGGKMDHVRSRLKATVIVSTAHAKNIGNLLIKQTQKSEQPVIENQGTTT